MRGIVVQTGTVRYCKHFISSALTLGTAVTNMDVITTVHDAQVA
jgi:hypothetical protein